MGHVQELGQRKSRGEGCRGTQEEEFHGEGSSSSECSGHFGRGSTGASVRVQSGQELPGLSLPGGQSGGVSTPQTEGGGGRIQGNKGFFLRHMGRQSWP